jgi:glutaredoxin
MKPSAVAIMLCMLAGVMSAHAQVYKWIGPDGKIQYSDTPPPSSTKTQPQTVATPSSSSGGVALPYELAEAMKKNPVTLYSAANCAPCDTARTMLISRGVPFSEKTVRTTEDVAYLREVSGDSQVPVMTLGKRKHQGFSAAEWEESLAAAGYPASNRLPKAYRNPPPEAAAPHKEAPVQETAATAPEPAAPLPELPSPTGNAPPGFRF